MNKYKGSILIIVSTMIVVLGGFTALAIDVGRLMIIRGELQNAADAAALTGAGYLYPSVVAGTPNWTLAETEATSAIALNVVDNAALLNGSVETGYWNISGGSSLQSTAIVPTAADAPAVQVTVMKAAGQNGGPVELMFGPLIGVSTVDVGATGIAVMGSPQIVGAGLVFPIAIAQSLYDQYWDSATNEPEIDPGTGLPWVFQVAPGPSGEWTSFLVNDTSASTIRTLIQSGNPTPLNVGDVIYLNSGVKNSLYNYVPIGAERLIPIVNTVTPGGQSPITAFGAIVIIGAQGGANPYVSVQLINNYEVSNGTPGGMNYGVYTPPKLVK